VAEGEDRPFQKVPVALTPLILTVFVPKVPRLCNQSKILKLGRQNIFLFQYYLGEKLCIWVQYREAFLVSL